MKQQRKLQIAIIALATIIFTGIMFRRVTPTTGATPSPGHPWADIASAFFQVVGQTTLRTFTFPDQDATVLTTLAPLTVSQGGTGLSIKGISLVQHSGNNLASATSITATTSSNFTPGNLVVVSITTFAQATLSSVTDNKSGGSNAYVQIGPAVTTPGNANIFMYYAKNVGAANVVTVATGGAATEVSIAVAEFSGADTLSPVEASTTGTGTSAAPSLTLAPALTGDMIFATVTHDAPSITTATGTAGYVLVDVQPANEDVGTHQPVITEYKSNVATGSQSVAFSFGGVSSGYGMIAAAFKAGPTGIFVGNGTSSFTTVTAPAGAIVGDTDVQTLSNKIFILPSLNGIELGRTTITATTTLTTANTVVLADASSNSLQITLPTAVGIDGVAFSVKRIDASTTTLVTVVPQSGQTIDGITKVILEHPGESLIVQSNNANWFALVRRGYDRSAYRARGATLNQWYTSPFTGTALTTGAVVANQAYATPFVVAQPTTIDQMAINATASSGGSAGDIAIYADNGNLYPGARIASQGGTINTNSTGVLTFVPGTPIALDPGLYWLAFVDTKTPTLRTFATASLNPILGFDSTLSTTTPLGWTVANGSGVLGATFPVGATVITAAPIPTVFVRILK